MHELLRDFALPNPLYSPESAWNQTARHIHLDSQSAERVEAVLRMLDVEGMSNSITINVDEFTIPIYRGQRIRVRSYDGQVWKPQTNPSTSIEDRLYYAGLAVPIGPVRPALPLGLGSDGHLVLVDLVNDEEHDFFQATTQVDQQGNSLGGGLVGTQVLEAGAVAVFKTDGLGAQLTTNNQPLNSARATGVPLLAGLLVPEDLQALFAGSTPLPAQPPAIRHALAMALPCLRCVAHDCAEDFSSDWVYPASKTETKNASKDPLMLAGGERIRLSPSLQFLDGTPVPEDHRAQNITRIFFQTLREHGAYLVDASGSVAIYVEESTTANLKLSDEQMVWLIGRQPTASETPWQAVMNTLADDLDWRLAQEAGLANQPVPIVVVREGSVVGNIEVIAPAIRPAENIG